MEFNPLKVMVGPKPKTEDKDSLYVINYGNGSLETIISQANLAYKKLDADTRLKLELEPPFVDLAKIACKCYEHYKGNDKKVVFQDIRTTLPTDYKLICCAEKGSYHGCIYFRGATKTHHTQLLIAHKGTTPDFSGIGDIETDIDGVAMGHYTQHQRAASTFAIWVLNQLNFNPLATSSVSAPHPPAQIIFTGHSLGGWLAQVSSFSAKYHQITQEGKTLSFTRRFDNKYAECDHWFHPRCIVFDSPGAYQMIEKLWHRPEFRDFMAGSENPRLDIKNLAKCPNHVNCINWHFGDLLLLPGEKVSAARKAGQDGFWAKKSHTNETHDRYSFVEELGKDNFLVENLILVKLWPHAVFRGYSTSKKAAVRQFTRWGITKIFETLGKTWKDDIFNEFNAWYKKQDTVLVPIVSFKIINERGEEVDATSSISTFALSMKENRVVENIRKIIACHFYGNEKRKRHFESCKELKPILGLFRNAKWEEKRVTLQNKTALLFLQNLSYFSFPGEKWAEMTESEIRDALSKSKAFVDKMKEKYVIPKFTNYENLYVKQRTSFANKKEAELNIVKILSSFENCAKSRLKYSEKNTLFLKSKHFRNDYDYSMEGISLVVVNCLGKLNKFESTWETTAHAFVAIFLTPALNNNEVIPRQNDQFLIEGNDISKILNHKIQLPNCEVVPLSDIIMPADFKSCAVELNLNPTILLKLLEKESEELVQIGKAPSTVFENEGNYFHVGKVFNEQEIVDYYKKSSDFGNRESEQQLHNRLVVLITESSPNRLCSNGTKIISFPNSQFELSNYFKICSENPTSFVDLVYFNKMSQNYQLKYQYNPDFYKHRKICAPTLDLGGWANDLRALHKTVVLNGGIITQYYRIMRDTSFNNCITLNDSLLSIRDKTVDLNDVSQITFGTGKDQLAQVEFLDNKKRGNDTFAFEFVKIPEKDLFSKDIVILSDEPGMGKSTNLTWLSANLNSSQLGNGRVPWVIFIELKSLNILSFGQPRNSQEQLEHVINFMAKNQDWNPVEKFLFKTCLLQHNPKLRLVFVLDGFDEMVEQAQNDFLPALHCLSVHTSASIYISTRRHLEHKLESNLGVFTYRFVPIQRTQMVEFLSDLWFGIIKKDPEKIAGFAKDVISKSENYLKDGVGQIFGVPLLLKMLSEVFLDQVWDYVHSRETNSNFKVSEKSLVSLYEEFTKRKYTIYFQNKNSLSAHKSFSIFKEPFEKMFVKIVVDILDTLPTRPGRVLTTFMYGADFLADDEDDEYMLEFLSLGIAHKLPGHKPSFPHRTFYEYFLAKFIFRCIQRLYFNRVGVEVLKDFELPLYHASSVALENIFSQRVITKGGFVIRTFLNDLIGRDTNMLGKLKEIKGINVEFSLSLPTMTSAFLREILAALLSNDGQIPLLGFLLTCLYNFKDIYLIRTLKNSFFTATHFFLSDYDVLKPLFIVANILQKKHGKPISEIVFIKSLKKLENPEKYEDIIERLKSLDKSDDSSVKLCKEKLKLLANLQLRIDDPDPVEFCKFFYESKPDQRLLCLHSSSGSEMNCKGNPELHWHVWLGHPFCTDPKLFENPNLTGALELWDLLLRPAESDFNFLQYFQYLVNSWGEEPRNGDATLRFPYEARIASHKIKELGESSNGNRGTVELQIYLVPPMLLKYPEAVRDLLYLKRGLMRWVRPLRV